MYSKCISTNIFREGFSRINELEQVGNVKSKDLNSNMFKADFYAVGGAVLPILL